MGKRKTHNNRPTLDVPKNCTKHFKMKKRYKVVKRRGCEYITKSTVFVVARKTWFGFYLDTNDYYFLEIYAIRRCNALNLKKTRKLFGC